MPIISADPIDKKIYRITLTLGHGMVENVVVSDDGLYELYYIKDGRSVNRTGRIINVVQNRTMPNNSYILFDWSCDNNSRKERIYFHQVQLLKDITPNDAYRIAVEHGFVGSVEDWLESLRGDPGKDNYEIAVDCGFTGSREEWLESIKGPIGDRGYSAYEIAVNNGYEGTEEEWLESIRGRNGKSAYDLAVECGFTGTKEEWLETLKGTDGKSAYDLAVEKGFSGTEEEWLTKIGDVTLVEKDVTEIKEEVNKIKYAMTWDTSMGESSEDSGFIEGM